MVELLSILFDGWKWVMKRPRGWYTTGVILACMIIAIAIWPESWLIVIGITLVVYLVVMLIVLADEFFKGIAAEEKARAQDW